MNVLDHFAVPYKGLGIGLHLLHFQVDNDFFGTFEDPLIDNGSFAVTLELDKRSDHSILTFEVNGHTNTACDRCLADIDLPVSGSYTLHLKFSEEVSEDDEIVFIHPDTSIVNVAKYIYDVIGTSMPLTKLYDCKSDPKANCDEAVLLKLTSEVDNIEDKNPLPSPWDQLKGMNFDK